jgi:hypothetical protein
VAEVTLRVVIVGGPSRGKSTLADEMHRATGVPVYCGDPASKVVFKKPYTHYLPEGLDFAGDNGAAAWVCKNWFTMRGPFVCEGHVMARALRRWHTHNIDYPTMYPADKIIVLDRPAHRPCSKGQEAMHAGVMKVWREIAAYFAPITEYRRSHP